MNWIKAYKQQIDSGAIVVPKKIHAVYDHLSYKIDNPGKYHYDDKKGQRIIDFAEKFCCLSKGKGAGALIQLELWQKAFLSALFGFVDDDGRREYRECLLLVARKNGKSVIQSIIALYMLLVDNPHEAAECYSVATKRDQSKIVWDEAARMVKKSKDLSNYVKIRVGDMTAYNEGIFKSLASDSNSLDGLNASYVSMDEIHAWTDANLYDVMIDSMSARTQPLALITSTAGFVRGGIYDTKYAQAEATIEGYSGGSYQDDTFLPIIYELDTKAEWKEESSWTKANPALGTIKDINALRTKVNNARSAFKDLSDLLTKDFNLAQNSSAAFLTFEEVNNKQTYDIDTSSGLYAIGGFDLSRTTDLTSAALIFKVKNDPHIYVKTMSWITEDALEKHEKRDKVPYRKWIRRGSMRVCSGGLIDYKDVISWFDEQQQNGLYPYKIGYDPYCASYMAQEMKQKYGESTLKVVRQGAKTLSIPLEQLRQLLKSKTIIYNDDPVLKWCLGNLRIKIDSNGNMSPTKDRTLSLRDDAAMALLDALTVYLDNKEDYDNMN